MTASAKSLFRAIRTKTPAHEDQMAMMADLPDQLPPQAERDPLDYDPTPPDATAAFLAVEADHIRRYGNAVWEPAVGGGHMARELARHGFEVFGSDVVDRGHPGTLLRSFYDFDKAPCPVLITNPPYNEINARDGQGRWLEHIERLNVPYCAMLLNWDWIAARGCPSDKTVMDRLHERFPASRAYVCCWKIDFRGGGSPPQRNAWIVWDREWTGETVLRRLYRDVPDNRQGALQL